MKPPYRSTALLAAASIVLAGCGGHAATKNDVIARGNQICETAASSVRAVPPPNGQSISELARYYKQLAPIVRTEAKQLQALPRPLQDRALLGRYLDAVATSANQYEVLATAAQNGDRAALATAGAALRSNPAASLAESYGITRCGGSLGTAAS